MEQIHFIFKDEIPCYRNILNGSAGVCEILYESLSGIPKMCFKQLFRLKGVCEIFSKYLQNISQVFVSM